MKTKRQNTQAISKVNSWRPKIQCQNLIKFPIDQRNLQVFLTEIFKTVNSLAPPLTISLSVFQSNEYDITNFQILSNDLRKTVIYWLATVTYKAPTISAKLPSEYKLANSVEEFKVKIKTWKSDAGPEDYAKQIKEILNKSPIFQLKIQR